MVRARICAFMGLCLMLQAASTEAGELEFFVENRLGADSNIFRRQKNTVGQPSPASAGFFEISPRVSVRDDNDYLEYDFRYQPTYERFFAADGGTNGSEVSGLDHSALGKVDWRPNPRTTIGADGNFYRNRRLRQNFADLAPIPDQTLDSSDNERVQRSRASVFVSRSVNAVTTVRATYSFDQLEFDRSELSDSDSHTFSLSGNYGWSPQTTLGFSGTGRYRLTRASVGTGPPLEFRSNTLTLDFAFTFSRRISERLEFSVSAGPSFINTNDEQAFSTGDPNSPGTVNESNEQSVFAYVNGVYRWKQGKAELSYTRSESGGGGGTTGASIVDDISLSAIHEIGRDWVMRFRVGWNHRSSISSTAFFGQRTRVDRVYATAAVQRNFSPRVSLIARARISDQSRNQYQNGFPGLVPGVDNTSNTSVALGFISLRYTFEPFVF